MDNELNLITELAGRLGDITAEFTTRMQAFTAQPPRDAATVDEDTLRARARAIHKSRMLRSIHFRSDMFHDPAWDVLLLLYAEGETVVNVVTGQSMASASTTQRWIIALKGQGYIHGHDHPEDRRRTMLRLTPIGEDAMRAYLLDEMRLAGALPAETAKLQ